MIDSINFMGREGCLTKPARKVADKTHEYFQETSVIGDIPTEITNTVKSNEEKELADINLAYRAAHAPFLEKPSAEEEFLYVMDGQARM